MDLQGMKRKKLQALCKKHGLPANVTNVKLADSLAAFFKGGGGGTPDEEPPPSCSESSEGGRRGDSKKKSTKKVTFFMEGNQVHEFIDLDSDLDEAEPVRLSKGRRQRASIRSGVVVPNVTRRRQFKAMEIRSPVLKTKMSAVETIVRGEPDGGPGDEVTRRITRSLRGREISIDVQMGKPSRQEGSKKRKSLATMGREVGGVVKSSARTRLQMQISKLESEDKLCETSEENLKRSQMQISKLESEDKLSEKSEENLKIEMGKSGDQGDVKKRKNEEEAVVTINNQARTRMQTRSELRVEVCATKLEALKAETSVRSRKGVLKADVVHDQSKTGEGGRRRRPKLKSVVSGDERCGSDSSIPKGTDVGLHDREILRRSKRYALKTMDRVANVTNEQNGKEGRRGKIRERPLEHKPSTSKDSILVNGEGTMHVEETLAEPQCPLSRKSKSQALKSPISSHETGTSSTKKAKSSSKSQKKPKNCDVDNQNFHEIGSISYPNICTVGKEGNKVQLNELEDMGSIGTAQGVEKFVEERDGEEQGESLEVERRETEARNEVEENMIKNLAVHPSEEVSEKFICETNLTSAEPCKVMNICVNIQQSTYDEERLEQFQLAEEADEKLSAKKIVLAENSSSTLEDADLRKEDQGTEFESVGISASVCRTIEKEIDRPHGGACFSASLDARKEDNQPFQKSTNYDEIHGCNLEVLEEKDSCYLHNEHLSLATNMEDFTTSFDEVLSTELAMLSEVDHAIHQQPLEFEKAFYKEETRETDSNMRGCILHLRENLLTWSQDQALNDQNEEESENNNSLQSTFLPGSEESRKENGFVQGFNFGDQNNNSHICEEHLNDENKKDCEDKNSPQLMSLCGSEDFRIENGFVQDFNVCDKNDISDTYEEPLNDENKKGSEDNNSLQSVLLRGCEDSRKENGSAQGFNLGNENDNSDYFKDPVNDDLTSTEDEEINCEIDRKENIKACNDDIVNPVDFHVEAFILENNSTEALCANFVICEHEKSTLETICNQEVPMKETISPVHNDPSLRNEKCKSNMLQGECDFKDELKEDKEETYETILKLKFDDKSAVGVDTFEGNDHRASKGLGYQNVFVLPTSDSTQNDCTGSVQVSNIGIVFSQEFCLEDDEGTSMDRTRSEEQHTAEKLKEKVAEIAGRLKEEDDHDESNVSSIQKDVWGTDNSGKKDTTVRLMEKREENFGCKEEDPYTEEIFKMLSAMDSMPTKTNTLTASTEDNVINEPKALNEAANLETGEFCDASHEISKEEMYALEQREHDNIVELEKGGTKEQAREDIETFESTAEDPPALSNESIAHVQTPVLKTFGVINEVSNASELTGQEEFSLSTESTQIAEVADSSADGIKGEPSAEADFNGAKFSLAKDKEDLSFKFENCCDPEVSTVESILQIDDEDELNGLVMENSECNENDLVQIVESDDTLENQGQDHKVMSPLSTRQNGQQSACSEGESIENADRDTLSCEENIDYEVILHNKLDMQNEELLGNREDELVERKLISSKEMLSQNYDDAEQTTSCEKLSNVSTSQARHEGFKKNGSECSNISMIHTTENEDSLKKQGQDHESVSRLSAKINEQQQSVFSEGESIENANRETFSYEAMLHSKLDIQTEELLDQDGEVVQRKLVSPMEMLSQNDVIAQQINNFGCEGLSNMSASRADSIGLLEGETSMAENKEAIVTEVSEDMNISLEAGADCNVQGDEEMIERHGAQNEEADDIWDSFAKLFEIEEFNYETAMEQIEALNLETQLDEVNNLLASMHVSSGRKAGDRAGKARSKTFNPISKLKKWFSTSEMKENSHMKQKLVRKNNSMEKSATPVSRRRPLKQIGNQ